VSSVVEKSERQARQRAMEIEGGQRIALGEAARDSSQSREQLFERVFDLKDDFRAAISE
jgi:hypothetical protein